MTDVYTVINDLKTLLNTNSKLTDPRITAGETRTRTWWHGDDPYPSATFPRGQILLIDNNTDIIAQHYTEMETAMIGIIFYSKKDFGITVSGNKIKDEMLCHYYGDLIRDCIKDNRNDISDTWGIKILRTEQPRLNNQTNIYSIILIARVMWFNLGC